MLSEGRPCWVSCGYAGCPLAQDLSGCHLPIPPEVLPGAVLGDNHRCRQDLEAGDEGDPLALLLYPSLCCWCNAPALGLTASHHVQAQLCVAETSPASGCRGQQSGRCRELLGQRGSCVPPPDGLCTPSQQSLLMQVPELAGFLLLSFLIQLPLLLFLLTDSHIIRLPLEMAVHSLFLAFLVAEIVAAFLALKTMTKQLAAQFYLRQFKEGSRGRPGQGDTAGQVAEEG